MEHKLIQGGDQYLPFARSRIKALKATGLKYASQKFEIDGVSIRVRIAGEHEYIELSGGGETYMESGQLEWTFPGEMNPTRYDPASWRFLDIPTTDKYLGGIRLDPPKKFGEQIPKQILTGGMESRAIGYPKAADNDLEKAEKDAASKEEYGSSTIVKKVTAGYFPSSLFSGKLRLFIQAQYGAREVLGGLGLSIDALASSFILKYRGDNESSVQLGVYSHLSAGLFTAPDKSYWLIVINNPTGEKYIVKAYKIKLSAAGVLLRRQLYNPKRTAEEKQKIEAYILSDANVITKATPRVVEPGKPDIIENPVMLGEFAGRMENAMAYGWKFNTDGSEARVVVHQVQGTDSANNVWLSRTITVGISYATDPDSGVLTTFGITSQTVDNGAWTDGWGAFNIFVPSDDPPIGGVLAHWSLATNRLGVRPEFDFSVPVYGYYKDNVWVSVTISRMLEDGPFPKTRWTSQGITFESPISQSEPQPWQYGYSPASAGCSAEQHTIYKSTRMNVSVGSEIFQGLSETGIHTFYTRSVSGGAAVANPASFVGATTSPFTATAPLPAGYPAGAGAILSSQLLVGQVTRTTKTHTGTHDYGWTLVIPTGDCEAVYVARREFDREALQVETVTGDGLLGFSGVRQIFSESESADFSFTPWTMANSNGGWFGVDPGTYTSNTEEQREFDKSIYCFNAAVSGAEGFSENSYYTLFIVSRDYPFYDPGMSTITGYGKRYYMSEGLKSPDSVNSGARFVGWA